MRQNMELMPVDRGLSLRDTDAFDAGGGAGSDDPRGAAMSPSARVHMLLRGRYRTACILAAALGAGFGALGWKVGHETWQSSAQVRVQPVVPKIMYEDPDKATLPMFDSFVDAQAQLIGSQRLLDVAMSSDTWKQSHRPAPAGVDALQQLQKDLRVDRPRGSELITITISDEDPKAAQGGAQAIIDAYQKLYIEADSENGQKRLEVLQDQLNIRRTDYNALKTRVNAASNEVGMTDKEYEYKLEALTKFEGTLQQLDLQLAAVDAAGTGAASGAAGVSADDASRYDPALAQLLAQKRQAEQDLAIAHQAGLLDAHQRVRADRATIAELDHQIDQRVQAVGRRLAAGLPVDNQAGAFVAASPEALRTQRDRVKALYDAARKELKDLSEKRTQLDVLRQDADDARKKFEEVQTKIDQLNVEAQLTGRIKILSRGDRPVLLKDSRPKLTGMGAFFGILSGFGLVLLAGLTDRRFRTPEEARVHMNNNAMLGVLPNLPDDLSDPEQAAVTAHFVHQIRTLLQIWGNGSATQVFGITSPVAGTGKTSLTLALGVSFAASSRTLLIDCDLIGGGLTARANTLVKRKIGRILQREGYLSEKQLEEALRLANGSRRRLGEILVELGYLRENDLTQALVTQQRANVGLLEALAGEPLDDCIAETGVPGLHVLPLGAAGAQDISRLTPQALRKLLDRCREQFDTILIDSGPTPGSLEASAVASAVDGVILCVSRGEHRPLAEKCVHHLQSLGARVAGIVFNRARTEDMAVYSTTIRSSQPAGSPNFGAGSGRESARFGPMARAVASSTGRAGEEADPGAANQHNG